MPPTNPIPEHLSVRATTLEEAWSRFDPQEPLPVGSPFYVAREDNPLGRLKRGLLLVRGGPPKYFFAGHRGCGKSTELNRLVTDPDILARYWPVKFSVRDELDLNDLGAVDVLLAIGAQVYRQYAQNGGHLDRDLLDELESWKGQTIEHLRQKGAVFESGAGFDLGQFFLSALLKVKTEHATRQVVRQVIGPRLSELIQKINLICYGVQAQSGRPVRVVVEDMDKPPLEMARRLFEDAFSNLTQPNCAIVYTVPVAIYFDPAYTQIRETSYFLPNVKLHEKGRPEARREAGVKTMRHFALARMDETLLERAGLDEAVRLSGGVFREMAHILQRGIDNALARTINQVELPDVAWAAAQIRTGFRRLLTNDQYRLLLQVRADNEMLQPDKLGQLFHILAVLEYSNGETWCDVHPVLNPLLDNIAPLLTEQSSDEHGT